MSARPMEKQFEDLLAEHYDTVYKYVLASLSFDRDKADDCMQDIVMLLWQKKDKVAVHPNPGGFFVVTAKNYIMKYKSSAAYALRLLKPLEDHAATLGYEEDFINRLETPADIESLKRDLLSRLTDSELALYDLFYEKGRRITEVASQLQLSESNVKVRLYRLRIKVKNLIRAYF